MVVVEEKRGGGWWSNAVVGEGEGKQTAAARVQVHFPNPDAYHIRYLRFYLYFRAANPDVMIQGDISIPKKSLSVIRVKHHHMLCLKAHMIIGPDERTIRDDLTSCLR